MDNSEALERPPESCDLNPIRNVWLAPERRPPNWTGSVRTGQTRTKETVILAFHYVLGMWPETGEADMEGKRKKKKQEGFCVVLIHLFLNFWLQQSILGKPRSDPLHLKLTSKADAPRSRGKTK